MWPYVPERPRLLRLCRTQQGWTQVFLAAPTGRGIIDPADIERIHPMREGCRPQPIGRTDLSQHHIP